MPTSDHGAIKVTIQKPEFLISVEFEDEMILNSLPDLVTIISKIPDVKSVYTPGLRTGARCLRIFVGCPTAVMEHVRYRVLKTLSELPQATSIPDFTVALGEDR